MISVKVTPFEVISFTDIFVFVYLFGSGACDAEMSTDKYMTEMKYQTRTRKTEYINRSFCCIFVQSSFFSQKLIETNSDSSSLHFFLDTMHAMAKYSKQKFNIILCMKFIINIPLFYTTSMCTRIFIIVEAAVVITRST